MPVNHYLSNTVLAEGILIADGRVSETFHINKFGYNPAVGTSFESITDIGNGFNYIGTPTTLSVVGASDTGAMVEIQGLDENYDMLEEQVLVGSSTTSTFSRVFRAKIVSLASGTSNQGSINIRNNGTTVATISAGNGQTLMAVYTVPRKHTAFLMKFQGSVEKNKECEFRIMSRKIAVSNGIYNIKGQFGSFGMPITYDYPVPLKFTEKTDIEIQSKAGATTGMGVVFDLIIVKN